MSHFRSKISGHWKAYVALLNTADNMLRHADYSAHLCEGADQTRLTELQQAAARGELCPYGQSREIVGVFSAFAFEAYLNHLGEAELPCWKDLERLSWESKLRVLSERLRFNPDYGARPFQTLKKLFHRRNKLAHGQSVSYEESVDHKDDLPMDWTSEKVTWAAVTQLEAKHFVEDVRESIRMLNQAGPSPDNGLFLISQTSFSTAYLQE